ncbi:hypothetical protein HG443_001880 [Candidatus Saccharibacteria bacterium]|nr:hypothetical protein [Candidatus Saccharibacteria bacterium]
MGIVIINGKRYDSVTGLMLSDRRDELELASSETDRLNRTNRTNRADRVSQAKPKVDDTPPVWVGSYIDGSNEDSQVEGDTGEAITVRQVKAQPDTTKASEPDSTEQASDRLADYVELFTPADDEDADSRAEQVEMERAEQAVATVNPTVVHSPLRLKSARRIIQASRTLNRRFVKKPLRETGEYAESIAVRHIKQVKASAIIESARSVNDIPDETIDEVIATTESDFTPVLTKSQATSLKALTKKSNHSSQPAPSTTSLKDTKAEDTTDDQSALNLSKLAPTDYDDLMDDRIDQLTKILQASNELDQQDRTVAKRRLGQPKRHRFRFSTIMATAGAMAIIVGLGVYISLPTISVKLAAGRAGINAKNPYALSGYSLDNNIAAQPGKVTISYKSASGNGGYSVTQESDKSTTDYALRLNVSRQNGGSYQEMDVNGKTVLLYGNKATWLAGDMRYTIDGSDLMDSNQLRSIVKSL